MFNTLFYALQKRGRRLALLPLLTLLLLASVALPAHADDDKHYTDGDGYYMLFSAEDLKWFADEVYNGNNKICGRLYNDIYLSSLPEKCWRPIGGVQPGYTGSHVFKGKFDGKNHVVYGLKIRPFVETGLFGRTDSATIENLVIDEPELLTDSVISLDTGSSHLTQGSQMAVVVGNAYTTTVRNCHVRNAVLNPIALRNGTKWYMVGGICGSAGDESLVKNCSMSGYVMSNHEGVGGIVGYLQRSTIDSCHVYASKIGNTRISGTNGVGGICGVVNRRTIAASIVGCTVTDSIELYATVDTATAVGTICGAQTLSNELEEFNGYYEINTPANLVQFASKVNGGETSAKARLMSDINMSASGEFTPMGSESKPFCGVFEGNGHTIDSLTIKNQQYAGLFGYVKDGSIKDLTLSNPTLLTQDNNYLGFIVGLLTQNTGHATPVGYIENCHVTNGQLLRSGDGEPYYIGGIAGKADMSAAIRYCSFQGTIKAHDQEVGGIVGQLHSGATVSQSFVMGPSIVWGDQHVGGIIGYLKNSDTDVVDCYVDQSAGQVEIHGQSGSTGTIWGTNDGKGEVSHTKYTEDGVLYEQTGRYVNTEEGRATETKVVGVSTQGGDYHVFADIGSAYDYKTSVIESMKGAATVDFIDVNNNKHGKMSVATACNWIDIEIADYAFDSSLKGIYMRYYMKADANHTVMLGPKDVRPQGKNMLQYAPNAKIYVDAEYYDDFCTDSLWSAYKDRIVPTTSMRTEDMNAEYGARYAYDRKRDKRGSIITLNNGSVFGSSQVHVIGADNSYLTSDNEYILWIYQDIGETYDYNTTKIWASAFNGNQLVKKVQFQEIMKNADSASESFVIAVGDSAFANCPNLTAFNVVLYSDRGKDHVEFLHPSQMPIGKGVFDNSPNVKIWVPRDMLDEFKNDKEYGWAAYKDLIYSADFGYNDFKVKGVRYSYYTTNDGKTHYTNSNNEEMSNLIAKWSADYRNFTPSKVLEYGNSAAIRYVFAKDLVVSDIESNNGELRIYNDIGDYHNYKTIALAGNAFQNQKCIKNIVFEDCASGTGNAKTGLSLAIPSETFKGCSNLEELSMFYYVTDGTNHYEAIKPSQVFIGENVFDGVSDKFRIRVLPEYYTDYITDPNWSQYTKYIVAAEYLPTTLSTITRNGVTYDYASKVMNGLSTTQNVAIKSSAWNALIIAVEVAITAATYGSNYYANLSVEGAQAAAMKTASEAYPYAQFLADRGLETTMSKGVKGTFSLLWTEKAKDVLYSAANLSAKYSYANFILNSSSVQAAIALQKAINFSRSMLDGMLAITSLNATAVGAGNFTNSNAINYVANRVKKKYERPDTWKLEGQWLSVEKINNIPQMYVKSVADQTTVTIYNDVGQYSDDYQTVAVASDAFHNKKNLKEVKFQERYGESSRSLTGLTIALPDSMFAGCTNLQTLNFVLYSTGSHSENHCYQGLTPDNFAPMGDIFAGMDSVARSKVRIKVDQEALEEFLDDDYWVQYKDMYDPVNVDIVCSNTEWSCKYALAYNKHTAPLRHTVSTHDIDHVMIYAADNTQLDDDHNEGLAALINDYGIYNNYQLDYVRHDAFKGNKLLKTLDIGDSHSFCGDVYTGFDVTLGDSAFAHCPNFKDLNLIYQITTGENRIEPISPSQLTLGRGVFDDCPNLRIKFSLDQEEAFLADTAWVKYKDKFHPCLFEAKEENLGSTLKKSLLENFRFKTDFNSGTDFPYIDGTKWDDNYKYKLTFAIYDLKSFDEFRAFSITKITPNMFKDCTKLQSIRLPENLKTIEKNAFENCTMLRSLRIPASVRSMYADIFKGSGIKEFFYEGTDTANLSMVIKQNVNGGGYTFSGLDSTYVIYVPDSLVNAYKREWYSVADHIQGISKHQGLKVVTLTEPGTLAEKLGLTYNYTSNILEDNSLEGNYAQYDSLRIIGPLDGRDIGVIRYMGGRDVDECDPTVGHLKYLDLYDAELKKSDYDYLRHTYEDKWYNLHFNNSITEDNCIDKYMFYGLDKLETLILPRTAIRMKYHALRGCTNLKYLVVGDDMNTIDDYVAGETNSKQYMVMLGKQAPKVNYESFLMTESQGVDGIFYAGSKEETHFESLILPYGSERDYTAKSGFSAASDSIMSNFEDDRVVELLKQQHIFSPIDLMATNDITGIFAGDTRVRKFDELFYSSVTTLGDKSLTGMKSLEKVTLPYALKKITVNAFKDCSSLRNINAFCFDIPELEENAFNSLPTDFVIWVSEGCEDLYRKAWPQYESHIQGYRSPSIDIREITLTRANTLADSLGAVFTMDGNEVKGVGGNLCSVLRLKVSGPIGGKDIALLRYLGGREPDYNQPVYTTYLRYLDLYDAQLKSDNFKFLLKGTDRRIEKDNEVPKDMFWKCDHIETLILPRTATKVNYEACYDMASLKRLVIGDDVTSIDDDAFGDNRNLEDIIFLCKSKPTLDDDAFTDPIEGGVRKVQSMYVRRSLLNDYYADEEYTDHTSQITSVSNDDDYFCALGSKAIATEDDLASVTSVRGWFTSFPNITKLDMLNRTKVTSIGKDEFRTLKNLKQVAFPSTLSTIDAAALDANENLAWADFSACDSLKTDLSTLQRTSGSLLYQPQSFSESQLSNVVYGKNGALQCADYFLTDTRGYDVPKAFTAKKVTFGREFTPRAYSTITLPFAVNDVPDDFKFYTLNTDSTRNDSIYFKPVATVTANSPYVVRAKTKTLQFEAETVVPSTNAHTNSVRGTGYTLIGNIQPITSSDVKASQLILFDPTTMTWNKGTQLTDSLLPFTAYAQVTNSTAATNDVVSRFSDCLFHYYIGSTVHDLYGDNTNDDPLFAGKVVLEDGKDFRADAPFTAQQATYTRSSQNQWATLCLPYAFDASDNTTCDYYQISEKQDTALVLTRLEGEVEAGTPVLVRRNDLVKAFNVNAFNTEVAIAPLTLAGDNTAHLEGTFKQIEVGKGAYIISNDRFWLVDNLVGDKDVKVGSKPFRAYLSGVTGTKAASFGLVEDHTVSGVDPIEVLTDEAAEYYDLNGRRIPQLQRGVNIVKRGTKTTKVIIK